MTSAQTALLSLPGPAEAIVGQRVQVQVEGPPVPKERAWRLVGDTDWLNRVAGNGAVLSMELEAQRDGLSVIKGLLAGPLGLRFPFEEVWTSWVRGESFRQVRTVHSPLLLGTDYEARLVPDGDQVRPRISLTLTVTRLALPIAHFEAAGIARRWKAALQALAEPPQALRALPPAAQEAFARWRGVSNTDLVRRVTEHLATSHPNELRQLRGYLLADQWGLDRDTVLEDLLNGVDVGALELYWSVRCVRCYGEVASGTTLSDLADHATCPSCRIDFASDLGDNVEVLFTPHPSVMKRTEERFCTLFPAGASSQYAVITLAPGQTLGSHLTLPPGEWTLGAGGEEADSRLILAAGTQGGAVDWRASTTGGTVHGTAGPQRVTVHNDAPGRRRVYLTRVGGDDPRIPASRLTTLPAFRKRMGHQVLAAGTRIGVRSVALVFTDLSDSTAMYEEMGDAGAYALVRDHFRVLDAVIEAHGGTVVKTIGDAVMAAFHDAGTALGAALAMQAAFNPWVEARGLKQPPRLKIGLHVGPALAVHTDAAGIDYFGGTVNTAARAQGVAASGEVVWTQAIAADSRVDTMLAEAGLPVSTLERQLKGLKDTVILRKVNTLGPPRAP
jgi:class 3 adenylate cyclase